MKQFICIVALMLGMHTSAMGCDMCSCSSAGQYLGILPGHYRHFAGLQYLYTGFSTSQPSISDPEVSVHAHEFINTMQAWGKYSIGSRVQLFAFVPYHNKAGRNEGTPFSTSGVGDVSALANYVLLNHRQKGKYTHTLIAGGGIKAPTGRYIGISELDRRGLPNVQAGTGSWDGVVNANYTVWRNKTGLNAEAAYTLTTANADQYKYGNKLSTAITAFYTVSKGKWTMLPQVGMRYEYALHDYDNYSRRWLNKVSGGQLMFATAGIQAYYNRLGARATYSLPVMQNFSSGFTTSMHRAEAGIFFLF